MFKTERWHRFVTVPAMLVVLASVVGCGAPLFALLVFPPLAALPVAAIAAATGSPDWVRRAATTIRGVAWVMIAWSLLVFAAAAVGGVIALGVTGLLFAAIGRDPSEAHLAAIVGGIAAVLVVVAVPLIWVGAASIALLPASILLFISSIAWALESVRPDEPLPAAIALERT